MFLGEDEVHEDNIIIDIGTTKCLAGFSSNTIPKTCINTYLALQNKNKNNNYPNYYTNPYYYYKNVNKNFYHVIEHGRICNWDCMTEIFKQIFVKDLKTDLYTKNYKLILTEPILTSKEEREKLALTLFEYYDLKYLYIGKQPVLSLIGSGKYTGLSLESGGGVTQIAPVYEGAYISWASQRWNFGGEDLTELMLSLMSKFHYDLSSKSLKGKKIREEIKTKKCYIAENYENEKSHVKPICYTLPDNSNIYLEEELIKCPESIFNPKIINENESREPIVDACFKAIEKCDNDIKHELYKNIVLSGGNTMFKGFNNRFSLEMKKIAPNDMDVQIHDAKNKMNSAWEGACVLSKCSFLESCFVTNKDYQEYGTFTTALRRKCFY